MIRHIWSVLCRRSVIDTDSNNISIYDVFEQLRVDAKVKKQDITSNSSVNIPLEFEIVSMWVNEDKEKGIAADVDIEVFDPNGKQVKVFPQKLELSKDIRRLRSRLKIMGLAISMSGDYIFKVKIKEKGQDNFRVVAELPLEVNLQKKIQEENNKN